MAVACASRFSVLTLEDDVVEMGSAATTAASKSAKGKATAPKTDAKAKAKAKKKAAKNNEISELQSLAFSTYGGKTKNKASSSSSAARANAASDKQWEEWKQKDNAFVSDAYEQDLQQALLLSKIDYEEKKDVYEAMQKESEQSKNKKKKKNQQKKEKGTMSLEEFHNLGSAAAAEASACGRGTADLDEFDTNVKLPPAADTDFFAKIEEDAEKIISKEQKQEQHFRFTEPVTESALALQFQEELRKKDEEITGLNEELLRIKEELKNVKVRNKKLYNILILGEMKEKAEILVQNDKLQTVKDELTEQISEYHAALEQERSKVHALQMELKKCQNSKKNRTESK